MASPALLLLLLPAAAPAPHIVVILADDLGFHDVPWHNPRLVAPHLQGLAEGGVTLEHHYSHSTCSPSRAALLTGRHAIHTGLHTGALPHLVPQGLDTSLPTLAEVLGGAGYSTAILGKWHLGLCNEAFWPTSRGFHEFLGFLGGGEDYYSHRTDGPPANIPGYDFRRNSEVEGAAEGSYSTDLIADRAVSLILEHNATNPLFLYLPFQAPHDPLMVDAGFQELYSDIPFVDRQKYLGMVSALDAAVGRVVEALQMANMYDDTIILFLSDNGAPVGGWPGVAGHPMEYGGSNWPLRGAKLTLWEGGTRTPAFIHAPALLAAREEQAMVHVSDWFPTLLSAAGLAVPEGLDGVDLWPRLVDPELPSPREELLYSIFLWPDLLGPGPEAWPPMAALRQGDMKFIWRTLGFSGVWVPAEEGGDQSLPPPEDARYRLYDLAADPGEERDLAEELPEVAAAMLARLQHLHREMGAAGNATMPPADPAGLPELHGGYWAAGWC